MNARYFSPRDENLISQLESDGEELALPSGAEKLARERRYSRQAFLLIPGPNEILVAGEQFAKQYRR